MEIQATNMDWFLPPFSSSRKLWSTESETMVTLVLRELEFKSVQLLWLEFYSKSLMVKCGGPSDDNNISNLINVDVDMVGDFCRHIRGIWLILVQTLFTSIILCINLDWISSLYAFAVTTLIMVCNSPLANMQMRKLNIRDHEEHDFEVALMGINIHAKSSPI